MVDLVYTRTNKKEQPDMDSVGKHVDDCKRVPPIMSRSRSVLLRMNYHTITGTFLRVLGMSSSLPSHNCRLTSLILRKRYASAQALAESHPQCVHAECMGMTPLLHAVLYVSPELHEATHVASPNGLLLISCLLRLGSDPNAVCSLSNYTPTQLAATGMDKDVLRLCMDAGGDARIHTRGGVDILTTLAAYNDNTDMLRYLRSRGCDLTVGTVRGWTPLMVACKMNHIKTVKYLLNVGVDTEVCYKNGDRAYEVSKYMHNPVCRHLLYEHDRTRHQIRAS